ncbi:MAG: class I SAM-dependent methyltransferase [Verrucomicrobiia bacterium]
MILNRLEFALMNNPFRAALQRHVEARRFLRMGGPLPGGRALEIGCGRGVGVEIILDVFGAATVDAFDLDPLMIAVARRRLARRGQKVRLWLDDAAAIGTPTATYDGVFDFAIIHQVPNWRDALVEVNRVLRPGAYFTRRSRWAVF